MQKCICRHAWMAFRVITWLLWSLSRVHTMSIISEGTVCRNTWLWAQMNAFVFDVIVADWGVCYLHCQRVPFFLDTEMSLSGVQREQNLNILNHSVASTACLSSVHAPLSSTSCYLCSIRSAKHSNMHCMETSLRCYPHDIQPWCLERESSTVYDIFGYYKVRLVRKQQLRTRGDNAGTIVAFAQHANCHASQ